MSLNKTPKRSRVKETIEGSESPKGDTSMDVDSTPGAGKEEERIEQKRKTSVSSGRKKRKRHTEEVDVSWIQNKG